MNSLQTDGCQCYRIISNTSHCLCIANRALPVAFEHSCADDVMLNGKSCMINYGTFRHVVNKIPTDFF